MKKLLFITLLVSLVFNSGCLVWMTSEEMLMKKKDFKVLEENSRRLIVSEELYILSKQKWTKRDVYEYSLTPSTNTQFLGVIGAYKGLVQTELIKFSKKGRQIKEVQKVIDEQLKKLKEEIKKKKGGEGK